MSHRIPMLVAFGLACACAERYEPEPRLTPAAGDLTPDERSGLSSLERTHRALTNARCDREARCNDVGEDKTFTNRAECITQYDAEGYPDLRLADCRSDVEDLALSNCLIALENELCNSTLTSAHMVAHCGAAELCGGTD